MIEDRPAHRLADPSYSTWPPLPYWVDMSPVPDFVARSIADLAGIQPVTKPMFHAVGGELTVKPSEGEVALFRTAGTEFQLIWIIASLVPKASDGGGYGTTPFALSLKPAEKRGKIQTATIDWIKKLDFPYDPCNPPLFSQFNPLKGSYGLFGTGASGTR